MKRKSERRWQILGLERCIGTWLVLMLLAACGQKGALYLPEPLPGPVTKPGSAAAAKPKAEANPPSAKP